MHQDINHKQTKTSGAIWVARALLPLLVLGAAFTGFRYLKNTKPKIPSKPAIEKIWPVEVATVKITDYRPTLLLYGEAKPGRQVELRSLVAGEIIEASEKLADGAIVGKGDILLKIDPFKYRGALTEAEAKLEEARARLQEIEASLKLEQSALKLQQEQFVLATRDLKRATELSRKGTVSKKIEDDRRVIVSQRQQNVEQRRSTVEVYKSKQVQQKAIIKRLAWGVRQARRNLKDTILMSPFDAYVSSVNAEVGRIVSANDRVATLFDKNRIDVEFTLTDSQYGRIISSGEPIVGRDVIVSWKVSNPPIRYKAKIERVNSQISSETGGIEVFARISNPLKRTPIRAGAFVEVRVPDQLYKQVARLPQTALFESKYVYAIEKGALVKRQVEQIGASGNEIILKGQLKQGDKILTTRLSTVGEGLKVRVRNNTSRSRSDTPEKPALVQSTVNKEKTARQE